MELDKTDVKILKTMLSEARRSSRKIARKTDVSIGRVLSRMKKMSRREYSKKRRDQRFY